MSNNNTAESGPDQEATKTCSHDFKLVGVDGAIAKGALIRHVSWPEINEVFGLFHEGLLIPYHDIDGNSVTDKSGEYFRIKTDAQSAGNGYVSKSITQHTYIPPKLSDLGSSDHLIIVGSEHSSLALASEGIASVGCPGHPEPDGFDGYNGYANKEGLTPEFLAALNVVEPEKIIFIGEKGSLYDIRFAAAAVELSQYRLTEASPAIQVFAQCIPTDAPGESLAECRDYLGSSFGFWLESIQKSAICVVPTWDKSTAAFHLLESNTATLKKICSNDSDQLAVGKNLAKVAAQINDPLVEERIRALAESFGIARRPFTQEIKKLRTRGSHVMDATDESSTVVDISRQNAEWTEMVIRSVKDETYAIGEGQLAGLYEENLKPFTAAEFASFVDAPGRCRFVKTNGSGEQATVPFAKHLSEMALASTRNHGEHIRPVNFVSTTPVLVLTSEQKCDLITSYSPDHRILITGCTGKDMILPSNQGNPLIKIIRLLLDFEWVEDGSFARAIAMLLTPALTRGGFLNSGRAPLIVISKNAVGAGGGFLSRVLSSIYGHQPTSLVPSSPDKFHESLTRVLFEGKSIITLDNIRGGILSQIPKLESFLTEPIFDGRMIFRHGSINVEHVCMLATSNGMTVSRDIADRSIEISIRKRPFSYTFTAWPEGNIFKHIAVNRNEYLSEIYGAIQNWVEAGMPGGSTTGFRFSEWERATSWIVEQIVPNKGLKMFPQGSDHRIQAAERMSNPDFDLVTNICHELHAQGHTGKELSAAEIASFCGGSIDFGEEDPTKVNRIFGIKLKAFFREQEQIKTVGGGFQISKSKKKLNGRESPHYTVTRVE